MRKEGARHDWPIFRHFRVYDVIQLQGDLQEPLAEALEPVRGLLVGKPRLHSALHSGILFGSNPFVRHAV
jgi:hypothetical protein